MKRLEQFKAATLAICMAGISLISGFIGFSEVQANAEETRPIKDYYEISTTELDERTYRTEPSDKSSQITVFTHGLSVNACVWSNDRNG